MKGFNSEALELETQSSATFVLTDDFKDETQKMLLNFGHGMPPLSPQKFLNPDWEPPVILITGIMKLVVK